MITTIVVVVERGNVQGIYTDNSKQAFQVVMLDYDNFNAGQEKDDIEKQMEQMIEDKQLNCIY